MFFFFVNNFIFCYLDYEDVLILGFYSTRAVRHPLVHDTHIKTNANDMEQKQKQRSNLLIRNIRTK